MSTDRQTFLVERYWPGMTRRRLDEADERLLRAAGEIAGLGVPIRVICSTYIPADEIVLTLVEAVTIDDVIEAGRRGEVPFDRIQPVEVTHLSEGARG